MKILRALITSLVLVQSALAAVSRPNILFLVNDHLRNDLCGLTIDRA